MEFKINIFINNNLYLHYFKLIYHLIMIKNNLYNK